MQEILFQKIAQLNPAEPYVWRLALSVAEFEVLQNALLQKAELSGKASLLEKEWAIRTIVYLAEWYKRCYSSNDSAPAIEFESNDLQTLWSNSGIDQKRFVYTLENGNRSWRYSIYVLGGLAIKLELGKKDTRYLKELCKLYHGDSDKLDNLDDAARAAAFRKSISDQASLYNYFRTILNGSFPFAKDELCDKNSDVNTFIQRIKSANDEVLHSKFRIEWLLNFSPDSQQISRKLRLWLKPEEIGGTLHQYLRFDRVHLWGVKEPEKIRQLRLSLRFSDGAKVILPADKDKPLITYLNTGCNETGFLSLGVERSVAFYNVPVNHFSAVEIVVFDDNDEEYIAEKIEVKEWWQLFRINPYENEWSSTPQAQHETALLCSTKCQLTNIDKEFIHQLPFYNKQFGTGPDWFWYSIHDSVTFIDEHGKEITLFNRQGYDQITTCLHTETLRYTDSGMVKYYSWNDEYDDHEEEFLPLLLSKDDLIIRHFATKDAIDDAQYEKEVQPEAIEFLYKGKYCPWDEEAQPDSGKIKLRVTVKGREYFYQAFYLPLTICRDFENCQIIIGNEPPIQDDVPADNTPAEPVISKQIEAGNDYLLLEIWRPFLRRELICNGKVIRYLASDECFAVPYILKDELEIQDFSELGYRKYFCSNIGNIYELEKFSCHKNNNLVALQKGETEAAVKLDVFAPEWLDVCFAAPLDTADTEEHLYQWDYVSEPVEVSADTAVKDNEIIFYDAKNSLKKQKFISKIGEFDAWEYPEDDIDLVKCFETAIENKLYFFELHPFQQCCENNDSFKKLYESLYDKRNHCLTEADKKGLRRLAAEFSFNWQDDYNIEL